MNRLPTRTRAQILSLLVEGMSLQSIGRHTGITVTTVTKLLSDAGDACARLHDRRVTGVSARHVECDELKTFCYAKEENLSSIKAAPAGAGDVWIWTALDRDSDLILAWRVGGRTEEDAERFAFDLASRLADRPQLFTDGHEDYEKALKKAFGESLDHGQIVKTYDERTGEAVTFRKRVAAGKPAWKDISTGRVERRNLDMRTRISRLHRRAITYSKRPEKLRADDRPLRHALQLRAPGKGKDDAGHEGGPGGRAPHPGMDRVAHRRAGPGAQTAEGLPPARLEGAGGLDRTRNREETGSAQTLRHPGKRAISRKGRATTRPQRPVTDDARTDGAISDGRSRSRRSAGRHAARDGHDRGQRLQVVLQHMRRCGCPVRT